MSFSFTLFEKEIESTLSTAIDEKVAAMDPGDGKDEAEALTNVIADGIVGLSRGDVDFASAYVRGSVTSRKAELSINVNFKQPEPETSAEPIPDTSKEAEAAPTTEEA